MAGTKTKEERFYYITPDEFKVFLKTAYDYKSMWGIFWDITGKGGFRISEVLSLKPPSFDFVENIINVATLKRKNHPIMPIVMPESVMLITRKYIDTYHIEDDSFLFPYTRQWAWYSFKKVLGLAKLNLTYSPHALRHMHAIVVAEATGGDALQVAKRLRHSSTQYVFRYFHLTLDAQRDIVKFMEKRLK